MFARLRGRLSYANVISTLCLFLLLGGAAYAAITLPRNSVSSRNIVNGSVRSRDLAANAVKNRKLAADAVTGDKILDQTLTGNDAGPDAFGGDQIDESTLSSGGDLSGPLSNLQLGNDTVGGTQITDGSVGPGELAQIPSVRARRTTAQSIANSTLTTVALTTETWDHGGLHSNSINNSRLTAPIDGVYLITANVFWDPSSAGERMLGIRLNGTTFIGLTADSAADTAVFVDDPLTVSTAYLMNSGDFVQAMVQQNSGASLSVGASSGGAQTSPEVSMTWLGP